MVIGLAPVRAFHSALHRHAADVRDRVALADGALRRVLLVPVRAVHHADGRADAAAADGACADARRWPAVARRAAVGVGRVAGRTMLIRALDLGAGVRVWNRSGFAASLAYPFRMKFVIVSTAPSISERLALVLGAVVVPLGYRLLALTRLRTQIATIWIKRVMIFWWSLTCFCCVSL